MSALCMSQRLNFPFPHILHETWGCVGLLTCHWSGHKAMCVWLRPGTVTMRAPGQSHARQDRHCATKIFWEHTKDKGNLIEKNWQFKIFLFLYVICKKSMLNIYIDYINIFKILCLLCPTLFQVLKILSATQRKSLKKSI